MSARRTVSTASSSSEGIQKKCKNIKIGIIAQNSNNLNVYSLFTNYFSFSKPRRSNIKSEHYFEFVPNFDQEMSVALRQVTEFSKVYESYSWFNTFIIMIYIQDKNALAELEKIVNCIVDASEKDTKKCYVFGFFEDEANDNIPEVKITTMLDAKGIDYEYTDLNINETAQFTKVMEYVVNDSCDLIKNKMLHEKDKKEFSDDKSKSHCIII